MPFLSDCVLLVTTGQMCTACASIKAMPVASSWHWPMPDAEWPKCYDWGHIWQSAAELNTWTYACLLTPLKFRTICLGQQWTGQTRMPSKNKQVKKKKHTQCTQAPQNGKLHNCQNSTGAVCQVTKTFIYWNIIERKRKWANKRTWYFWHHHQGTDHNFNKYLKSTHKNYPKTFLYKSVMVLSCHLVVV